MTNTADTHPNADLIASFYEAFGQRDYETMGALYADSATFSDPVFIDLDASETRAMWHMLCDQGKDLLVTVSDIEADNDSGSAVWEARYSFGPEGRYVHNVISAEFVFADGRILSHADTFDLWKWTRMAIGLMGVVGGWTSMIQNQVRTIARRGLADFIEKHPEYQ